MNENKILYFAYGSNMNIDRMRTRLHTNISPYGTYILKGYELVFDCGSRGNVYANIKKGSDDSFVEGVLYEIDSYDQYMLDICENFPLNYEKLYFLDDKGNICYAYISVEPLFKTTGFPTAGYYALLKEGAKENGLAHTLDFLEKYEKENNVRGDEDDDEAWRRVEYPRSNSRFRPTLGYDY